MIELMYLALSITAVGGIAGEMFLEKLIDFEYTRFPNSWVGDGRPYGRKITRHETSFWTSGFSRIVVHYDWLFVIPWWAQESSEAKSLLRLYRLWAGVFLVGFGALLSIAFIGR